MKLPIGQYLRLLKRYLAPQKNRVWLLFLLLVVSLGLDLYNPQIIRRFIDTVSAGSDLGILPWLALIYIGVALIQQLARGLARVVSENVAWTATNELRADLSDHCLRLDLGFHKAHKPGEMVERIDGDVNALSTFFSQFTVDLLGNLAMMLGVLVLLSREDWRVGLAMGGFAGVTLGWYSFLQRRAVKYFAQEREASAQMFGFIGEVLGGTEDIRVSGSTNFILRKYFELHRTVARAFIASGMAIATLWSSSLFMFAVGNAIAFSLSAVLLHSGSITIGTVYLIFHYTELLRRPMDQLRTQLQELQRAQASIDRIEALLAVQPQIRDGGGLPMPAGQLGVEFDQVSFRYEDDDEMVLHDLNFRLAPGKVMGLLGRTGSGKSTLARMLLRFYDAVGGEIRLGGVPIREALVADLRSRVGFVTQDVQLFEASVRDNLTFFDPEVPDERILEVLDELGLTPWLQALPHGLETEISSGGGGLSAGEAQLLAFARVFLQDPGLVILDEASSRLDPATETLLERAVDRLLTGRTGIIIAHRLATVQRADAIMILEDGHVAEHGPREALAQDENSRFAQLLRTGLEEVMA